MKKIFILFFLTALIITQGFSQESTDAQKVLDQLTAKVKSAKGISAVIVIKQFDKYGHPLVNSDGLIKIKGNKYYLKEDNVEVFCNGVQTWNFDGDQEVTVSKTDADDDDITPQQILSGFNKKDFSYKLISSSGNTYQVLLLPVDKRKNFKQVVIFINKSTAIISKAVVTDKAGIITEIDFSKINFNAPLADNLFVFDGSKHPNVEIINQ